MVEKLLVTDIEAAKMLGVSVSLLQGWRQKETGLPYLKIMRSVRYRVSDVKALVEQRSAEKARAIENRIRGSRRGYREVAAKTLGRRLKPTEVVHHINGDRRDNRNCNLLICTDDYHRWLHWRMSLAFQSKLLPSPLS